MIETLDDIVTELAPRFHINDVRDLWEAEMLRRIRAAVAIETTLAIGAAVLKGLETNPPGDKTPKGRVTRKNGEYRYEPT